MSTALLYLFAFGSGVAALIYQVAWSRILSMTFGSSTLAVSAVVAGFMGGMGIGAWLYHRVGDRVRLATRAYGVVEIGIALSTALFTRLYLELPHFFAGMAATVPPGVAMNVFRVVVAFILLLVPCILMGATYPALCQVMLRTARDVERKLGWIYGLNTVGAAVGAVVAGFVLIEFVGSTGAVSTANGLNLAVGVGALLLARRTAASWVASRELGVGESLSSELPYWATGLVLFGSGFATLGYEIVWFRALHYILGPGTYVLSSALTVFLLGLGFGSFLYRAAIRFGRPEWVLGFGQLGVAILALLAIGAEHYILVKPALFERISAFSGQMADRPWQLRLAIASLSALAIMLPATLWMGLSFPLASRLFLGSLKRLTSRVGFAYLLSNLGSIIGSISAAVWILPSWGTVNGTKLLAGINVVLALVVFSRIRGSTLRVVGFSAALLPFFVAEALPARLHFQPALLKDREGLAALEFEEESDLGTVQVFEHRTVSSSLAMAIDGIVIAATRRWNESLYSKQVLLAHLPMVLDRGIRSTLNLGVASGSTVKELSRYSWVESLDAVEINPAVVRGSSLFLDSIALNDRRAKLVVEDALHYLLSTDKTYDLIINDAKQHMRFGGSSRVLSAELYQYSYDRLSECGLFVQFVSIVQTEESFGLILRTVRSVFPELELFLHPPGMLIMVGSRCPIAGRQRPTRDELRREGVAETIESLFFPDATALDSLWVADGKVIDASVPEGPINSWDRLPLEFMSYRIPFSIHEGVADAMSLIVSEDGTGRAGSPFVTARYYDSMHAVNRAVLKWMRREYEEARGIFAEVLAEDPQHLMARRAARALERMRNVPMLGERMGRR